jgi:2',3'-cyclic-nucleotide 2'-phosphodiesterase (5'-nucleotidase family)
MKIAISIQVFSLLSTVYACDGHDNPTHDRRSVAPSTVTPPKSALIWGDINILHTTDTHGWLLGHQKKTFPEPNYR